MNFSAELGSSPNERITLQFAFGIKIPIYCSSISSHGTCRWANLHKRITRKKPHTRALKQQNCLQNESFLLFLLRKKEKKNKPETNNPIKQMYLKSWAYKERFVSVIVGSRMQCILLKRSQLCSVKGVYVRNAAKPWQDTDPGWFAMPQSYDPSQWRCCVPAAHPCQVGLQLCWFEPLELTPPPEGLPEAAGPVPFLAWGGGSGAKNRGCGRKKDVFTAVMAGEVGGEGWGRFGVSSTGKGNSSLLPSLQEPLPASPATALPQQLYPAWLLGLQDGQSKWWGQQLFFRQRLASPAPETSPVCCTSCLVIALWFCFKQISQLTT